MESKDRIIVALDVPTGPEAALIIQDLHNHVGMFKIGLELISSQEASFVLASARALDVKLFWDNKFCDIPNTVGQATAAVASKGVHMLNVHATCGEPAMRAAVINKGDAKVLAVTVLTSLDTILLESLGFELPGSLQDLVGNLVARAKRAGVDGIICSPLEVAGLKELHPDLLYVTPGVRPEWAAKGDQKRVMTPKEAVEAGSDYLVIGRPITQPPDGMTSVDAAKKIIEEIDG
jgi:orotidine-5'-phosphate decarboxylase